MTVDLHQRRSRLMERARKLARTGEHSNHGAIRDALADDPDRSLLDGWLERGFAHQLDRLCQKARGE